MSDDWVAPDAGGQPGPSRRAPAPAPSRRAPLDATPRPVPLRPMTASDVLDGAFGVLKAQPAKVLSVVAVFVVPLQVLAAWMQRDVLGGTGFVEFFESQDPSVITTAEESGDGGLLAGIVLQLGSSITLPFVAAALTHLITGWYVGVDRTASDVVRLSLRAWPALLGSWVLVHLAELAGAMACLVPGLLFMGGFVVTAPAIAAERLGATEGMRRSWRLARRRFGPTLGIALLTGVVAYFLDNALGLLPTALGLAVGLEWGWLLLAASGIVTSFVTTPVVAAAAVLLYLDLRIRTEGLDVQLEANVLFDRTS